MLPIHLPAAAAAATALVAAVCDLRTRRIPNAITFGAAFAAFAFALASGGPRALVTSGAGWLLAVALFFPFFVLRGMGAGDVKLLGAIGAWLGWKAAVPLAVYTGLAGGVLAIVVMIARSYVRTAFSNLWLLAASWRAGVAAVPGVTLDDARGPRLAYALPIAVGTMVTLWLQ